MQQATEREILEETGIVIKATEPVYTFDVIDRDQSGRIRFHYVIIDLAAEYISGTPRADDDALDAKWVAAQELEEMTVSPATRDLLAQRFGFGDIR